MIDIKKATNEFIKYVQNFDITDYDIKRKMLHSFRVQNISKIIAQNLKLSKEEIDLATLIGLLHDIGRFEQAKKFGCYCDSISFDHGDFGALLLGKALRNYIETDIYDSIIIKAVKNHNKRFIDPTLTEKEMLFAKIIRDADKLDIFYEGTEIFWKGKESAIENSTISDYAFEFVKKHETVENPKGNNAESLDKVVQVLALAFDLNFDISFKILRKQSYVDRIVSRFSYNDDATLARMKATQETINDYVSEKILTAV